MYNQVLKYELNGVYHFRSYTCLIYLTLIYLILFLNAVYFYVFLFLYNFPSAFFSNEKRNSFYAISYYAEHIYRVKRKLDIKCYSYRIL